MNQKKRISPRKAVKQGLLQFNKETLQEIERRNKEGLPLPNYIKGLLKAHETFERKQKRRNKKQKIINSLESNKVVTRYQLMKFRENSLRENPTPSEVKLYSTFKKHLKQMFKEKELLKCKFQKGIMLQNSRFYIIDIYHYASKLAIEVDGPIHGDTQDYDTKRDHNLLVEKQIKTLRFTNKQVYSELDHVIDLISKEISIRLLDIRCKSNNPEKLRTAEGTIKTL